MAKKHSVLGGSSAERWLNCGGSIDLIPRCPPLPSGAWAQEGTVAHWLVEQFLLKKLNAKSSFVKDFFDDEMIDGAKLAFEYVKDKKFDELFVELEVDLSSVLEVEDQSGTTDIVGIKGRSLYVVDYKYGRGKAVDVTNNPQLIYYALGALEKFGWDKFDDVTLGVIQPRIKSNGKNINEFFMVIDELESFRTLFHQGAQRAMSGKARRFKGEWCYFCPGKVKCEEYSSTSREIVAMFEDESGDLPNPFDLAPEQISEVLKRASQLSAWVDSVQSYALDFAERGGKIPGLKLVPTYGRRRWIDEDLVTLSLPKGEAHKAFETKLKSPAKLEKIFGKQFVANKTIVATTGKVLVPEDDPREALDSDELTWFSED